MGEPATVRAYIAENPRNTGVFVLVVAILCAAGLAVGLYFLLRPKSEPSTPTPTPTSTSKAHRD